MSCRSLTTVLAGVLAFAGANTAHAAPITFHVNPDESSVTFETTAVESIIGGTSNIEGDIQLDPDSPNTGASGTIVISAKALKSDNAKRDEHMHANALESETYPSIRIAAEQVRTEAEHLADGEQATFTVTGTLQLHGQDHEITFTAQVRRDGDTVSLDGETNLMMTDYGITPPRLLFIKVRDLTDIRFHIVATTS